MTPNELQLSSALETIERLKSELYDARYKCAAILRINRLQEKSLLDHRTRELASEQLAEHLRQQNAELQRQLHPVETFEGR